MGFLRGLKEEKSLAEWWEVRKVEEEDDKREIEEGSVRDVAIFVCGVRGREVEINVIRFSSRSQ